MSDAGWPTVDANRLAMFVRVPVDGADDVEIAVDEDLQDPVARFVAAHGRCPPQPLQDLLLSCLSPGQTVVDVGAHIGTLSVRAAARGGRVIAIEAAAENAALLAAAAERNALGNLTVVSAAAGPRTGRLAFAPHLAWGHVRKMTSADDLETVVVRAVTVDDLVCELGQQAADLIKINVEGWEHPVIAGMTRLLGRDDAPALFFQINALAGGWYAETPERTLAALEAFGYAIYIVDGVWPPALVRWHRGLIQAAPIVDYFACKQMPAGLSGLPPFDHDELVRRLVVTAEDSHGPYRSYPALAARGAARELVADPRIQRMLRRLRADPDVNVRRAAAWSEAVGESNGYENRMGADVSKPAIQPALIDPYVADDVMPLPASDRKRRVEVRPGLTVTFVGDGNRGDPVLTHLVENGLYIDEGPTRLALDIFKPEMHFLDLGAHVGTFSLAAAGVGCHVLAVDGSPRNVGLLRSAATANGFSRMTVAHAIVGDVSGSARFLSSFAWGHVARSSGTDDAQAITVRAATVDELLRERAWTGVDFVKMDVEGFEIRALAGMVRLLKSGDAPILLFEANAPALAWYGSTPADLLSYVEGFGYSLYLVDNAAAHRLIRWNGRDLQPVAIDDYIAVKSADHLPAGWEVVPAHSLDEHVNRFVHACRDAHASYVLPVARTLRDASPEILAHPDIRAELRRLRGERDEGIALAAAWSESLDLPDGVRVYVERHRPILKECIRTRAAYGPLAAGATSLSDPYVRRCRYAGGTFDLLIADLSARIRYPQADLRVDDLEFAMTLGVVEAGDVVFDVGAHHGVWTLAFARHVESTGHVHAFELLAPNCDVIRLNARLNDLTNITVVHAAVGEHTGTATASVAFTSVSFDGSAGATVPAVTLDQFADRRPHFVKIDASGYEAFVLEGARAVLATQPGLAIAVDPRGEQRFGRPPAETLALVDWASYQVWAARNETTFRPWAARRGVPDAVTTVLIARRRQSWRERLRRLVKTGAPRYAPGDADACRNDAR